MFGRIIDARRCRQPGRDDDDAPAEHLGLDQTVRDAIALMETGRYRNVPLVDDDGQSSGSFASRTSCGT